MTTDQLISLLVADLKPVDRGRISRALIIAMVAGAVAAFGTMFLLLGPRPEIFAGENSGFLVTKLLFTSGVVATAAVFLPRLARPGADERGVLVLVFFPFIVMAAIASAALVSAHWSTWGNMVIGKTWLTCLFSVPFLAIAPFGAVVLALRIGAPTARADAGAIAGLVAGGWGAMACSLPCLDDSLPSIAVWYGLTIGMCATLGAKLGPSLLRW
ncbi:MAG: DUF1109 domain-containing protein [Xanthobacteraceae bacterium]|nr:DUF1109 domain-containing protein [Xanthobacteraceae bacterium]